MSRLYARQKKRNRFEVTFSSLEPFIVGCCPTFSLSTYPPELYYHDQRRGATATNGLLWYKRSQQRDDTTRAPLNRDRAAKPSELPK